MHEDSRTLLVADALMHLRGRLGFGPRVFCEDIALGRHSVRRLAELEFDLVGFGHGPELRDRDALVRFALGRR
jgi:glyoxylase-like metal-dependent hydrolase (beta-lactamase superfamily II)